MYMERCRCYCETPRWYRSHPIFPPFPREGATTPSNSEQPLASSALWLLKGGSFVVQRIAIQFAIPVPAL